MNAHDEATQLARQLRKAHKIDLAVGLAQLVPAKISKRDADKIDLARRDGYPAHWRHRVCAIIKADKWDPVMLHPAAKRYDKGELLAVVNYMAQRATSRVHDGVVMVTKCTDHADGVSGTHAEIRMTDRRGTMMVAGWAMDDQPTPLPQPTQLTGVRALRLVWQRADEHRLHRVAAELERGPSDANTARAVLADIEATPGAEYRRHHTQKPMHYMHRDHAGLTHSDEPRKQYLLRLRAIICTRPQRGWSDLMPYHTQVTLTADGRNPQSMIVAHIVEVDAGGAVLYQVGLPQLAPALPTPHPIAARDVAYGWRDGSGKLAHPQGGGLGVDGFWLDVDRDAAPSPILRNTGGLKGQCFQGAWELISDPVWAQGQLVALALKYSRREYYVGPCPADATLGGWRHLAQFFGGLCLPNDKTK